MTHDQDTEELLQQIAGGELAAVDDLLERHRAKLRWMVAARMDRRVSGRFDPSDVVQDTLLEASRRLERYADERPLPFYPWLRQVALDRLKDLYRRHLRTHGRSVLRETKSFPLNESVESLAGWLVDSGTSPTRGLLRDEVRLRVREALKSLSDADREILLMRHLEQMTVPEIAAAMELHPNATKSRLRRALERLHYHLTLGRSDGKS